MRVWTVQPLLVWERLQEAGTLRVDPTCLPYGDGYIPWQYEWMAARMQERIPEYGGGLPWWAYCRKPDLRWVRHSRPKGYSEVRIELEVDHALAFPGWAWDVVYAGHFLAFTETEREAWMLAMRQAVPDEDLWPLPEPWRGELEASWLLLFAPNLPAHSGTHASGTEPVYAEAVLETLRLPDVRAVTHFVGNSRRRPF